MCPACAYERLAIQVDGIVAGSGDAIATIAGIPSTWRSGVAIADPPLPNAPERKPTPAPINAIPTSTCMSTRQLSVVGSD